MRDWVVGLVGVVVCVSTYHVANGADRIRAIVSSEPSELRVGERARITVALEGSLGVGDWTLQPPSTPGRIGSLLLTGPPRFSPDRQSCAFDVIPTLPESVTLPSFRISFSPPDDRAVATEPLRLVVRGQLPPGQPLQLRDEIPLLPVSGGPSWLLRFTMVIAIGLATAMWRRRRRASSPPVRRKTAVPERVEPTKYAAELAQLIEVATQGGTSAQGLALQMATHLRRFGTARGGRPWNQCTTEEVVERTAAEWDDVGASLCRQVLSAADDVKYAGRTPPLEVSLRTASRLVAWMSDEEGKR